MDEFDSKAWLTALHASYTESIQQTMRDFAAELSTEAGVDGGEPLETALAAIEQKMLWSVQVNIDRLENFYNENNAQVDGTHAELLKRIEDRGAGDADYQERVDSVFREIQASCGEFSHKKQKYLKFCLYDKYLDKERALTSGDAATGEFFDVRVREEQIHARARQEKEFLKDFGAYVELFGNMQTDLLRKLQ